MNQTFCFCIAVNWYSFVLLLNEKVFKEDCLMVKGELYHRNDTMIHLIRTYPNQMQFKI